MHLDGYRIFFSTFSFSRETKQIFLDISLKVPAAFLEKAKDESLQPAPALLDAAEVSISTSTRSKS